MPGHDPDTGLGDRDQPVTVEISSSTGVMVGSGNVLSVHQHDGRLIVADRYEQHLVPGSAAAQGPGATATVNNYYGTRTYAIDEFPTPSRPDTGWLMAEPSRLLDARSQVVPFIGRETELQRLRDWRDSTEARLSVLLLHAPGGQGKTRLAAEFAEESRRQELAAARRWQVLQAGFHNAPPRCVGKGGHPHLRRTRQGSCSSSTTPTGGRIGSWSGCSPTRSCTSAGSPEFS